MIQYLESILKSLPALADARIFVNKPDQAIAQTETNKALCVLSLINQMPAEQGGMILSTVAIDIQHPKILVIQQLTDAISEELEDYTGTGAGAFIQEMWQTNQMMAVLDELDRNIYRIEYEVRWFKM